MKKSAITTSLGLFVVFIIAYMLRPLGIIHGPIMFFYKYPLLWKLPLIAFIVGFIVVAIPAYLRWQKNKTDDADDKLQRKRNYGQNPIDRSPWDNGFDFDRVGSYQRRQRNSKYNRHWTDAPLLSGLGCAVLALIFATITVSTFTGQAIYKHYQFDEISRLPANGKARILPKEVAEQLATSGYNSPTSKLAQAHIVLDPDNGNISWTFGEVPNGVWRHFTAKTQGVATLNAESTSRELNLKEQDFNVSTNVRWTDNIQWQAYKKHFFTEVAETVYLVKADGEPVIIAPYLKYTGFWVKVPELAGVYVVYPDGEIEDLSVEEAEKRPFIVRSGRLFPESLARRIQDSYQYKNGILNRYFTHKDQTQINDTENNSQPYLMDFGNQGTKWVSTAQPYGKSQATNAIFMTDTTSGKTSVWRVADNKAYTGNSKALEIVRGLSIPGITFASIEDAGGKFQAVEPRPIVVNGQFQFMISIIPTAATTVTKTVIVGAQSNKAVAVFNHDTDPEADAKLKRYLDKGTLPSAASDVADTISGEDAPDGQGGKQEVPGSGDIDDAELAEIINQLHDANQAQADAIEQLEAQLQGK